MNTRFNEIVMSLNRVAITIGDSISADRLEAIAHILEGELTDEEFLLACRMVTIHDFKFPPPAKFIDYARPSARELAEQALTKVFKAFKLYSDMNPEGARTFVGEAAWTVVASFGGWYTLTTDPHFNLNVFRAQFLKAFEAGVSTQVRTRQAELTSHVRPPAIESSQRTVLNVAQGE